MRCLSISSPPADKNARRGQPKPKRNRSAGPKPVWDQPIGIRVTSMVRAADTVFVAGRMVKQAGKLMPGDVDLEKLKRDLTASGQRLRELAASMGKPL